MRHQRAAPRGQHLGKGVDAVGDDAIDTEVEEPVHLGRVVDGPDVHVLAEVVGALHERLGDEVDPTPAHDGAGGHLHGDGALKRFAGAVRSALLHADDVLARQGGEEFAVLLPGATLQQAHVAAARIRDRLREADIAHVGSPNGRMTASIGIAAMAPGESVLLGTLLTRADAALYRAKAAGRDRAEV